jgi:hypothetical protein
MVDLSHGGGGVYIGGVETKTFDAVTKTVKGIVVVS